MTYHPQMIFILGNPGAGKSTFVRTMLQPEYFVRPRVVISLDTLRQDYGYTYKKALEPYVNGMALEMARRALKNKHTVIIDECITSFNLAREFVFIADWHGIETVMIELATAPDLCRERRMASGFPMEAWEIKRLEWEASRPSILSLADSHITIRNPADMVAYGKYNHQGHHTAFAH